MVEERLTPQLEFSSTVFWRLGLQMFVGVDGGSGPWVCSGCDKLFFRERRLKIGQRNYCTKSCGSKARVRAIRKRKAEGTSQ